MGRSLTGACEYKCGNLHILKMGVRQLGILKILLIWQRVGKKKKKKNTQGNWQEAGTHPGPV